MTIIEYALSGFYDTFIKIISLLPTIEPFTVPDDVLNAVECILGFVGWLMPYDYYSPLLTFILSLTAFRIVYSIYVRFKK